MASIGDVFLRILADDKGFASDLEKKAGAAGDKAGKTLGQRMGQAARLGLTGLGAAGGALFGIAAKAGADLTNAMAEFQRETGATQEELESAQKSVVALSKSNLQSFDEIARAQAALRTDLGLTQAEAEAASQAFLDYGTATGRDAAEGVRSLDDILDAWNLDSSKSGEIMDKLVASHQKYGGSISENEAALSKLAPQLQALNLDVDDGIGLLNLFEEAGLDSAKAQQALNSAITKLPEGESLDEFIARLSMVEDDGERARLAIEVFGSRGGAGLANAIRPGVDSLDDFQIGMDEAAGATTEASDAIKNTPINQLTLAFKNLIGPLAEAGTHFAPLVLALSQLGGGKLIAAAAAGLGGLANVLGGKLASALGVSLGSKAAANAIGDGLASGLDGAGKSSKVKNVMSKLGTALGSPLGKALGIAAGVLIVFEIAKAVDASAKELAAKAVEISGQITSQIEAGTRANLLQSKAALEKAVEDLRVRVFIGDPFAGPHLLNMQAELDRVNAAIATSASEIPRDVDAALTGGEEAVTSAAENMVDGIPGAVEDAADAAGEAAKQTPQEIAAGILSQQGAVEDAMAALQRQMEEEVTGSKAAWDTIGTLVGEELAKGLEDSRPGVKAVAKDVVDTSVEELEKFIEGGGKIGDKAMAQLREAIENGTPEQQRAAQHIVDLVTGKLSELPPAARTTGQQTTANLASGIKGTSGSITSAATTIANAAKTGLQQYNDNASTWGTNLVRAFAAGMTTARAASAIWNAVNSVMSTIPAFMRPGSPPKEGPASTIDEWFPGLMEVFASPANVRAGQRIVARGAGKAMSGLVPPSMDWHVPSMTDRLASVAPSVAPRDVPAYGGAWARGTDGAAQPLIGTLHVAGRLPVRTMRDIDIEARAVGERHRLPRRRRPVMYPEDEG